MGLPLTAEEHRPGRRPATRSSWVRFGPWGPASRGCLDEVATPGVGKNMGGTRWVSGPLWWYLIVQAILLGTALLTPLPYGAIASYLVGLIGTVVLTVSVLRRRPAPLAGWRFVVGGAWMVMLAAATLMVLYLPRSHIAIAAVLPALV